MSTATMTRPTVASARSGTGCIELGGPVRAVRPAARAARPARRRVVVYGESRAVRPSSRSRLRLSRRGRLVLFALSALLLLAAISVGRTGSQAATATEYGPTLQQTTVEPGDTLWTVAERIAPQNDPREVVAQIRRVNHLESSSLRVGQQLLLPVR